MILHIYIDVCVCVCISHQFFICLHFNQHAVFSPAVLLGFVPVLCHFGKKVALWLKLNPFRLTERNWTETHTHTPLFPCNHWVTMTLRCCIFPLMWLHCVYSHQVYCRFSAWSLNHSDPEAALPLAHLKKDKKLALTLISKPEEKEQKYSVLKIQNKMLQHAIFLLLLLLLLLVCHWKVLLLLLLLRNKNHNFIHN